MKVGIVNDSKAAAEVLRRILASVPEFELAWTAYSGEEALQMCAHGAPDIILMDLIMPGIDGAETTRRIMQTTPCVILVVTATTVGNRDQVFEAMGYGALDAVNTPTLGPSGDMSGAEPLLQKLRTVARLVAPKRHHRHPAAHAHTSPSHAAKTAHGAAEIPIVALGASTGGPQALAQVLSHFPANFPAAVLIAQHVDEHFAQGLVDWLQHHTPMPVRIARAGEKVAAGAVYIAGTKNHLFYQEENGDAGCIGYTRDPVDTPYRPSVDVLFTSLAQPHYAPRIGVLLTGMGRDGAEGLLALRNAGALTIAQDAATSIVYGMPKAAARLKAASEILPLDRIGARICDAILKSSFEGKTMTSTAVTPAIALTERHIKVLLVDDQRIVGETIRRMLLDIPELEFKFCADPTIAVAEAEAFTPTVILQDLIMPGVDGIDMVRQFRANPATASTPLIVLSSKEEPTTKAEAFAAGVNDYLVKLPDKLELVARIRYHSAAYINRLQRDEAFTVLEAQQELIAREIEEAAAYVRSLLPSPISDGNTVVADWRFLTSSQLGGDSFGYHWLTPQLFAIYLLDVCGHGVGSALLSVSAINTIRNRTLPGVDFHVPSQVLAGLNRAFPMEEQNGKYFTMWYGVYNTETRELTHAAGGHPPAIAVLPDGTAMQLGNTGMMIGAFPFAKYTDVATGIAPGTKLFIYSDGCYEVTNADAVMMTVDDFSGLLVKASKNSGTLDRIVADVQTWQQGRPEFEDDFSLVEFTL